MASVRGCDWDAVLDDGQGGREEAPASAPATAANGDFFDTDDDGSDGFGVEWTAAAMIGPDPAAALFCPDRVLDDDALSNTRPLLPNHPATELPPGTTVWVTDVRDVCTLLRSRWEPTMALVCNGQRDGRVVRHSGDLVFVEFGAVNGVVLGLSMPRAALSKLPIDPTPVDWAASKSVLLGGNGNLGPRAGHDKKVAKRPPPCPLSELDAQMTLGPPDTASDAVLEHLRLGELATAEAVATGVTPPTAASLSCAALILLVRGEPQRAHDTALKALEIDRAFVAAHLRLWRACIMLGQLRRACDVVEHAALLLPHEPLFTTLRSITDGLGPFDAHITRHKAPMTFSTTYRFVREMRSARLLRTGDSIAADQVLVLAPNLECPQVRHCAACGRHLKHAMAWIPCPHNTPHTFCSSLCADKAWKAFLFVEAKTCARAFRSAEHLVDTHYQAAPNPVAKGLCESGRLALRLWSHVIAAMEAAPETPVSRIMGTFGAYPAPDGVTLDDKSQYQLNALCAVLRAGLTERQRSVLTPAVFSDLFHVAHAYRKSFVVPPPPNRSGSPLAFSVITRLSAGRDITAANSDPAASVAARMVDEGNAKLVGSSANELTVVATATIEPGEHIRVD